MAQAGQWDILYQYTESLSEDQKRLPRIRLYRAMAAEKLEKLDEASALLNENNGLEIPDIQEGEVSITELWLKIEEKKAARDGVPFDRATAKPPKKFDFRMNVSD